MIDLSGFYVMCMICTRGWGMYDLLDLHITFLSVGLHDLYNRQDLYDLRDFCMIWRISKIWILHSCLQHV